MLTAHMIVAQTGRSALSADPTAGSGKTAAEGNLTTDPGSAAGERTEFSSLLAGLKEPEQVLDDMQPEHGGLPEGELPLLLLREPPVNAAEPPVLPADAGELLPASGAVLPGTGQLLPPGETNTSGPTRPASDPERQGEGLQSAQPTGSATATDPLTIPNAGSAPIATNQPGVPPGAAEAAAAPIVLLSPAPPVRSTSGAALPSSGDSAVPVTGAPGSLQAEIRLPEPGLSETVLPEFPDSAEGERERLLDRSAIDRNAGDGARTSASISFDRVDNPLQGLSGPPAQQGTGTQSTLTQTIDMSLLGNRAAWSEPLAQRLATIVSGRDVNSADLRLNPPHLGRIEVRITLHGDQASILLSTTNPEVREALQQALPRLDSLLENLGIQLAQSDVSDQGFDGFLSPGDQRTAEQTEQATGEAAGPEQAQQIPLGIVDTYA